MRHQRSKTTESLSPWQFSYKPSLSSSLSESKLFEGRSLRLKSTPSKSVTPAQEHSSGLSTAPHSRDLCFHPDFRVLAPGPAINFIAWTENPTPTRISKEKLLTLAMKRNLRHGRSATDGLEEFLPKDAMQLRAPTSLRRVEKRKGKGKGFKQIIRHREKSPEKTIITAVEIGDFCEKKGWGKEPRTADGSPIRGNSQDRRLSNKRKDCHRTMKANIAAVTEKLNKRLILSQQANEIRASTMATVKICAKEQSRLIGYIPQKKWAASVNSRTSPIERSFLQKETSMSLLTNLETKLVDRLAAAEIETKKQHDREASYPKLSNNQLQHKLTRLRTSAEATLRPLEPMRIMEVMHMRNRRIR